jgi:hypothetical protein
MLALKHRWREREPLKPGEMQVDAPDSLCAAKKGRPEGRPELVLTPGSVTRSRTNSVSGVNRRLKMWVIVAQRARIGRFTACCVETIARARRHLVHLRVAQFLSLHDLSWRLVLLHFRCACIACECDRQRSRDENCLHATPFPH